MPEQERNIIKEMLDRGEDPLAEATYGQFHWNDKGMDEPEKGWEEYGLGLRVEVRTSNGWLPGTIRETVMENERGIVVECDEPYHQNLDFYGGKGASIMVLHNTRRGIWSNIRMVPQPTDNLNTQAQNPTRPI